MKKIPTLFVREYQNHKVVGIKPEFTDEKCKEAFLHGIATVKVDGACCAVINGKFYRRFDAKKGRKVPDGAIPCCEPDPITGHHPHWVPLRKDNPDDKWFNEAFSKAFIVDPDGTTTFEAIGPHFQANPYHLDEDEVMVHGLYWLNRCPRTFEGVRELLRVTPIEGIVFWYDGEPVCKIKRSDFGFKWPCEGATYVVMEEINA